MNTVDGAIPWNTFFVCREKNPESKGRNYENIRKISIQKNGQTHKKCEEGITNSQKMVMKNVRRRTRYTANTHTEARILSPWRKKTSTTNRNKSIINPDSTNFDWLHERIFQWILVDGFDVGACISHKTRAVNWINCLRTNFIAFSSLIFRNVILFREIELVRIFDKFYLFCITYSRIHSHAYKKTREKIFRWIETRRTHTNQNSKLVE